MASTALHAWLYVALTALRASPTSRAAATVRQQIVDSGLLEHLGPGMVAAADHHKAAVAALSAATPIPADRPNRIQLVAALLEGINATETCCSSLLGAFQLLSSVLQTEGLATCRVAWPAAPAAACLILTVCQTHSQLQTLRQQQPVGSLIDTIMTQPDGQWALDNVFRAVLLLAWESIHTDPAVLQSLPGAAELLLLPEFVSCLAIMLLVAVLGFDTRGAATAVAAARPAATSSGTGDPSSSSVQQQQQQAPRQAGSSSGGALDNGVQLDSLTPLSCSLFGVLGVSREGLILAAYLGKAKGITDAPCLTTWLTAYTTWVSQQVS
jgi:hypothetical protein